MRIGIRYDHAAPDGWVRDAWHEHLVYSRGHALVQVSPAIPVRLVSRAAMTASLELPVDRSTTIIAVPVAGQRWTGVDDADRCVEAFLLEDDAYYYAASGRAPIDELGNLCDAVDAIMRSVHRLPTPRAALPSYAHGFGGRRS